VRFGKYLKAAFINRWNLLAFLGGMVFAAISGHADVVAPLVLAGEVTYLGLLGSHPKFQNYVDVQQAKALRLKRTATKEQAVDAMLRSLPHDLRARFDDLRDRCLSLRQIANDIKKPGQIGSGSMLESLQIQGLDRLLWVFLRLLFTRHSLARFLRQTDVANIRREIERTEARLAKLDGQRDTSFKQKIRRTLQDNLATCRDRLTNYEKAKDNFDFVEEETNRLENKIQSLAEVAVNRQEPDYISSQIDQVASSMLETEQTMNELDFATGLGELDHEVPQLLVTE
jgi:hypothetical protein